MRVTPFAAAFAAVFLASCGSEEKFPVRTYQMGEKVVLGPLIYTAFETQWLTHMGEDVAPRVPTNRFFLIRVNITNSGGVDAMAPGLSIIDDSGNSYPELANGDGAPQWIGYLRQIRPAESAQGNLLFDAPPRHYKLRLSDESGERTGFVDIPLNFNAETPDVVRPVDKSNTPPDIFKK